MSSSKICMNELCGAKTTTQWKRGWAMKAGGFASLCYSCGTVYDHLNYCERFHLNEGGWRECKFCEKPIHCACVVSKFLHECLDLGGISCMKCYIARGSQALKPVQSHPIELPNGFSPFSATWRPVIGNRTNGGATVETGKLTQLTEPIDKHRQTTLTLGHQFKQDETSLSSQLNIGISSNKEAGTIFQNSSSLFNNSRTDLSFKSFFESKTQPCLSYSLGNPLASTKSSVNPSCNGPVGPEKVLSFKEGQKSCLLFLKPSKTTRVGRPPGESRGRNQLLPKYWPKVTDQELLQISVDSNSNCTITPLFEKVLSASDAGRIGRLVLPKACAETYFPAINQSEGLPIRIQDIKGNAWTFQFRFWPNNNSRMYVLEGVTPCIHDMQLQAGDTVIFSRLDPGDKLVIGCRKATVSADKQVGKLPAVNGGDVGTSSENGNLTTKNVEHEVTAKGDKKTSKQEKKKTRHIGLRNKRLHIHNEDARELKGTWQEAHELLRPSPTSKPTISNISDCEFEEYDEPPIFGTSDQTDLDYKKQKLAEEKANEGQEPSGLDALATAVVWEVGESSVGPTTKHPHHRPGCTCIVCIQPPSGKGKHKPNCLCNVCQAVKRRFKTFMFRKKQRKTDREAEMPRKSVAVVDNEAVVDGGVEMEVEVGESGGGKGGQPLDLNCDPDKDEIVMVPPIGGTRVPDDDDPVMEDKVVEDG